ncbi:uncharacterized protein B0I36DRAFT_343343 [Microdochium trichocladiopsis]|uniref:Uncharacterized protein n=1 Tax=Microdochium trichocladiopsis TaxID=1682393 RepID=A0A9P8XRU4_9PEZI|nr:uncharacterized protein B0I36DRAFT_343343 [Microdochium trichocladiopsis]KAH7007849.1 hypothetical protein B0I36DRAFT_343343 [Microdochium trichocladiopsis]
MDIGCYARRRRGKACKGVWAWLGGRRRAHGSEQEQIQADSEGSTRARQALSRFDRRDD